MPLREALLKTSSLAEFVKADYKGKNTSGYVPIGSHILVLPDKASEMTSGGIALTADQVDRQTMASETGVLVAVGSDAFLWSQDRARRWEGRKPQAGDRVYMQRYSGQVMLGKDGEFYRVMSDNCLAAIEGIE
jgi:chaperonin GroES